MLSRHSSHHPLEPRLSPHCAQQDDTCNAAMAPEEIALYPLPPVSMYQGQNDTILTTTSNAITDLATQLIEQLDARAKSLANGAQFDLALRDAAIVRALSPTSALGYLRAGYVYQQQGRQQAAIRIYKKGLKAVPSTDPGYSHLEASCAAALDAQEKRIDFMSKLPADIVSMTIVPFLFEDYTLRQDSICPYFYVSRTWRDRILENNSLHFHLFHSRRGADDPGYDLLSYSPHFKALTMDQRRNWLNVLQDGPWQRLARLNVDCMGEPQLLANAFESVGSTLTHLRISSCRTVTQGRPIALGDILLGCPNLVFLEATRIVNGSPKLLSRQHPKLTHLNVHYESSTSVSYENMVNVLHHLPSLMSLNVKPMPDTKLLPVIHQHRPNLKLLAYRGRKKDSYDLVYNNDRPGLESFCFGGDSYERFDSDDLADMLIEHCGSLKEIQLAGALRGNIRTLEEGMVTFERLEALEIEAESESLFHLATSIIRCAPHLERISIKPITNHHKDLFNAIINLRHLRSFSPWTNADKSRDLFRLISHHIELQEQSTLQELDICIPTATTNPVDWVYWVSAIARLQSLRSLKVRFNDLGNGRDYRAVMSILAEGCPALEKLSLYAKAAGIPKNAIHPFHVHPRLRYLKIEAKGGLHIGDGLGIQVIPNLKHLVLDAPIDESIVEVLRRKIRVVEYKSPIDNFWITNSRHGSQQ